ncbi:hypothetical protein BN1708_012035 [Verticillium longisporum]|uniref:Zn(2)-C6 fungal-type domain-containing protein n=1 Tax=Verticillium longisporum TaxID=100787 RepID=A0A0G4L6Q2_VERLO|nr:hypothetical protein BN1708_012035 [Verticillium longisporum]
MPNTGKPSRDCHLCRRRRVKCDLGRPSCQRCIKYGTECPGYRNEQDVVFRNETSHTIRRAKTSASKHQSSESPKADEPIPSAVIKFHDSSSSASTPTASSTAPFAQSPSAISSPAATFALTPTLHTRELREPWRTHSIPLLINCYAPVAFFSAIFEKLTSPDEPLIMATHLWARVYLGSCFHAPQDRRETALHLGNTLRSVALAIQDRDKGTSDGTILAVWILGMYELQIGGISGQSSRKSAWHVHLEGLLSLLRARGKAQFYTPFGRYIFWCVFMTLVSGTLGICSDEC